MTTGKFDLNMEEILESWDSSDAVREIIANALDETHLSDTEESEKIYKEDGKWIIRDYGRGLRYEHLTQSENEEKLKNPDEVIGKFGVGLKDSLATLYRNGVDVSISSKHGYFTVEKSPKSGFEEISTLHVKVEEPKQQIDGTRFVLEGIEDETINKAKSNFIKYSESKLLESTKFGDVYENNGSGNIYVTGIKIATEEDFLFSYNITNTTKKIRDSLNRERTNVGRVAYTDRVKKIIENCTTDEVMNPLSDDLKNIQSGEYCDELNWKDVKLHTINMMDSDEYLFVTPTEKELHRSLINTAQSNEKEIITVSDSIKEEIINENEKENVEIPDIDTYITEYEEEFEFEFIDSEDLEPDEQEVWNSREELFNMIDMDPDFDELELKISEELRKTDDNELNSVLQHENNTIIIKRELLDNQEDFFSSLLFNAAMLSYPPLTEGFEQEISQYLGKFASETIE